MDLVNDRASVIAEEDRISNLPHDVIHRILSFLDMKYAIQTSALSRKWEHTWTSMPHLKLNSRMFSTMPCFAKFVKHTLSHRDNRTEVSALELTFSGPTTQLVVKDIVNYAYLYNVRQLIMIWLTAKSNELPQYIFSSRTLKHLTLDDQSRLSPRSCIPKSAWDLPALETLNLTHVYIGDREDKSLNLISKCVNLKDITLHKVHISGVEIFNVCAPQLVNLTITDSSICSNDFNVVAPQLKNLNVSGHTRFPKVFNVVAPQLENLTATVSNEYSIPDFLRLSTEGFNSLEKVNLSLRSSFKKERHVSQLLDLFQILRSAKSLILDVYIIESLSSSLDQLSHEPCPFNNLKFLKINTMPLKQKDPIPTVSTQVKNYLLENSPRATFIMDLPQVSQKRSRQQVPNEKRPKKVAKVETGKIQLQTMADEKKKLEAQILMQDQVIAKQRAEIEKQDQVIAKLKAKIQMQNSNNIQSQSDHDAELLPVPGPSLANMTTS